MKRFLHENAVITKFNKVIVLQDIFNGVIRVQQTQTLAPAHHEASVLHRRDAPVVRFVFNVTFQRLVRQPLDGLGGVPARYGQPFISDVDGETRHCYWVGSRCTEGWVPFSQINGTTISRVHVHHQSRGPHGAPPSPRPVSQLCGTTDLHGLAAHIWPHWPACVQVIKRPWLLTISACVIFKNTQTNVGRWVSELELRGI